MPIVHVNVWEGFGQKNAKTVIRGITKVFVDFLLGQMTQTPICGGWVSLNP
jgi:phenylpyruvate tautomerase PptA (4-oxalocrotonate tautomerase family)